MVKRRKLQDRTIDQLAENFAALVLSASKLPASKADKLRSEIIEIEDELKARGSEHHTDLLPLADHPDVVVRYEAVAATWMRSLDQGRYKPS
ncbi:MAG: DUF2019 domain-containing protein [Alphaproteobacteria bacterium]|nr:DUF2019 domain-containing protein [Alphaproteobacteria bacterium]